MMDILRQSYELYGFTGLDTPVIEAAEVLLAKGGGDTEKQIYRFQKGDKMCIRDSLHRGQRKAVAHSGGKRRAERSRRQKTPERCGHR